MGITQSTGSDGTFGTSLRDLVWYADGPGDYKELLIREIANADPNSLSYYPLVIGPSRSAFDLFWDIHLKYQIGQMAHLYDIFRNSLSTVVAAGWIFKFRMHQFFTR